MRLLLVVLAASLLQSPARPDFSGSWKMIAARSESPNQTPPVNEMTFVIDQAADQIKLDMTSGAAGASRTISVTYPIVPAPKLPADAPSADERRAYWDTNRLILERGGTISGQTVSSQQSLTLGVDGEMIVERLVIVQHGYTLRGTRNYAAVKDVFERAQ